MSPSGLSCVLLLSLAPFLLTSVLSYTNGKVSKACGSMEPHHHSRGQTGPSPYHLRANSSTFSSGDFIKVVLEGVLFQGFLLQALDAHLSQSAVGSFVLTDPHSTQLLTCNKLKGSAVSHTNAIPKRQVTVVWRAPARAPAKVAFFATVVSQYDIFWVKIPGPIITQHGVTPPPPGPTALTPAPPPKTTSSVLSGLSGLYAQSWRIADGVIQCRFSRPVKPTNQESERFPLDQEYFLFVASGYAERGRLCKHSQQPLISERTIQLNGTPIMLRGSRGPTIIKVHGALMLLAWMLTGSLGTFIASFYKDEWAGRTLLGQKVWFQIHRGLMALTVALTGVGFCLPFIYRRGWSKCAGVHPYLGCCVLALSLLQPVVASFRPAPDSHRRCIFNWMHWGLGFVTELAAVAAMFLGVNQTSLPLPAQLATHILIGYVSWLMAFRILLFLHKHFYLTKFKAEDQQTILSNQSEGKTKSSWFKSLVVSVVILGNVGFLSALLSCITQL